MSDPLRPRDPVEGEYTDAELPLDAELPKDEFDDVDVEADDGLGDTDEIEVDVIDITDDDDTIYPPERDTQL